MIDRRSWPRFLASATEIGPVSPVLVLVSGVAIGLALWLRMAPIFADFPFGDGGLFWAMANNLRDNGFVPPAHTTFNSGGIPWVYPPLGLYLVAVLGGGLDLFRILPAVWAIATIPAVWVLARALIGDRGALIATAAYGLSASAYTGLIAGGGVTRAPGLLFALLTMWAVVRGHPLRAGIFGGLVLLTHPIAALYGGLGATVLWATRGADRRMLIAPAVAILISAAWFVPMVATHGIEPFLSGLTSRKLDLSGNVVLLLADTINPPNLAFTIGIVGAVLAIRQRRWDLVLWFLVTAPGVAVVGRWVVIPLSILAGFAVNAALGHPRLRRSVALMALSGVTMLTGLVFAEKPTALTDEYRQTMSWAATTPPGTTFAVIGYPTVNGEVEWFPAITGRINVTTWQGTEWIPHGFRRDEARSYNRCRDEGCLPAVTFYVLKPGCCIELLPGMLPVGPDAFTRVVPQN